MSADHLTVNQSSILVSEKIYIFKLLFLAAFFVLSTCTQDDIKSLDKSNGITKQEAKDLLIRDYSKAAKDKKQNQTKLSEAETPIPKMSQIITSPLPPKIGSGKIISFSITDQVPLKDALIELGRRADIDIDIDPNITGSIILNAKNRPLNEVIDRIAALGNLSYSYKNNILYFEKNTPYLKHYVVDYLIDGSLWAEVMTNISSIIAITDSINSSDATASTSSVNANKSAGIISVYATKNQQQNVERYLAEVQKNSSAQVLIEAKVVEVALNDYYSAGIDWTNFFGQNISNKSSGSLSFPTISTAVDGTTDVLSAWGTKPIAIGIDSKAFNLNATISLLEQFGVTKAISSPRIHAVNNQQATLDFVDKLVYFQLSIQTTDATNSGTSTTPAKVTVTSTEKDVDVGAKLTITPSINLKTNEILMNVKPVISVKNGSVNDPAIAFTIAQAIATDDTLKESLLGLQNAVPIIQTRQLSTIMKIKSGGVLVIGGLMKQNTVDVENGIPFLSDIPYLGNFFKSKTKKTENIETVIFIKATIVNSNGLIDEPDRKFHEGFSSDNKEFLKQQ